MSAFRWGRAIAAVGCLAMSVVIMADKVFPAQEDRGGSSVIEVSAGESIQAMIDRASAGATILVGSGIYRENLLIDKRMTLEASGGAVIDGGGGEAAVKITADGVTLRGFRIQGAQVGVWVDRVTEVSVTRNVVAANSLAGIYLRNCSGNQVFSNNVEGNGENDSVSGEGYGIWLESAHDNRLQWNHVATNRRAGLYLAESHGNMISWNTVRDNAPGWSDSVDVGCLRAAGGIVLVRSDGNVVEDNALLGNTPYGIELLWSSSNRVSRNRVEPSFREDRPLDLLAGIAVQGRGEYCQEGSQATGNSILANVTTGYNAGILLLNTWANSIEENTVRENDFGLFLGWWFAVPLRVEIETSAVNLVVGNIVTKNVVGIGIKDGTGVFAPLFSKIERNDIVGNREVGLVWVGWRPEEATVDARWNWWGDASGPHHPSQNPEGRGNPVGDGVEFNPWLTTSIRLTEAWNVSLHGGVAKLSSAMEHSPRSLALFFDETGVAREFAQGSATIWGWERGAVPSALLSGEGVHVVKGPAEKPAATLEGHAKGAGCIAFSPDGKLLAVGSGDGTVVLWAVDVCQKVWSFPGFEKPVFRLAWSPDGSLLASGEWDEEGTVRLWDVSTGTERWEFGPYRWSMALAFSPDGQSLLIGEWGEFSAWNITTGEKVLRRGGPEGPVISLEWNPEGSVLTSVSMDGLLSLWSWPEAELLQTVVVGSWHPGMMSAAWSPDRSFLAVADWGGTVTLRDPGTGTSIRRLLHPWFSSAVMSVAWHPTSSLLASGDVDGVVIVWDITDGRELARLSLETAGAVYAVQWSPDGRWLATAHEDGTVRLWDAAELIGP